MQCNTTKRLKQKQRELIIIIMELPAKKTRKKNLYLYIHNIVKQRANQKIFNIFAQITANTVLKLI